MPKRVLVAPLHWGLGHATRCIPIIQRELDAGNYVIVAAVGGPRKVIQEHFPSTEFIHIPFMEITYPADGNMVRHFFWRGPTLLQSIWQEHRLLDGIIKEFRLDRVISDSRFGLWNKQVESIFITHQIEILSPKMQSVINRLNSWVMRQYDEVWIPDFQELPGLAGRLSHPKNLPANAKYIGPLSRFRNSIQKNPNPKWDAVAIISGPEPQRSLFEKNLIKRFEGENLSALIISGKPGQSSSPSSSRIQVIPHLSDHEMLEAIRNAKHIISRSGYSTIMDFHVLGVEAEMIPTPGQTEQEYLAKLHSK